MDHATDAFFLQDEQLVVVDVNRQACQSLGYTRDELVGMTPLDFDPDVTPAMLEEFGRRLDAGEMLVFRIPPPSEGRLGLPGRGPGPSVLGGWPPANGGTGPGHHRA